MDLQVSLSSSMGRVVDERQGHLCHFGHSPMQPCPITDAMCLGELVLASVVQASP